MYITSFDYQMGLPLSFDLLNTVVINRQRQISDRPRHKMTREESQPERESSPLLNDGFFRKAPSGSIGEYTVFVEEQAREIDSGVVLPGSEPVPSEAL